MIKNVRKKDGDYMMIPGISRKTNFLRFSYVVSKFFVLIM